MNTSLNEMLDRYHSYVKTITR